MYRLLAFFTIFSYLSCTSEQPRISNFNAALVTNGKAYRHAEGPLLGYDLGENGPPPILDSIELEGPAARELVWELNRGEHYVQKWEKGRQDVLCHIPRFTLRFFNIEGDQTNYFRFCAECHNARVTNYANYPKSEHLVLSETGMRDIFRLRDELFPESKK